MPDPTLGAGLIVGGNLIGGLAGASGARRQNRELAAGARGQSRAGMEAAGITGDFVSRLRSSAPRPDIERGLFTSALGAPSIGALPTASRQFRADAAAGAAGAQDYGRGFADLLARIRAPQLQRQRESELLVDMGNALRPVQLRAQDEAFLTQLRANMKQPNPWLGMLGQGLSNVGGQMVAYG